jgi:hypothetical protein
MCALELERAANEELGHWPFEIGLWVGSAAIPNKMGKAGDTSPGEINGPGYILWPVADVPSGNTTSSCLRRRSAARSSSFSFSSA